MQPIDMLTILRRIIDGAYLTVADVLADLDLMVANAHQFNEPGSQASPAIES